LVQRFIWAFVLYGGAMIQLTFLHGVALVALKGFRRFENKIKSALTAWETRLLEQSLRVNTSPQAE
jgi:hypothetical protein